MALGIIEGLAETTAAILKLFSGVISDRLGKRKILVAIGYIISSAARPLTGIATAAWHVVVVRLTDRIGKGIRTAPRDALIASSVNESMRGRAYGFHRAMDHTGAVIGPLLAIVTLVGLVTGFGMTDSLTALRLTFLLAAIPGVVAVCIILFLVQEQRDAVPSGKRLVLSVKQFDRNFISYLSVVLLFTLGNSSDAFLLFRVEEAIRKSGALYSFISTIPFLHDMIARFGNAVEQQTLVDILFLPLVWGFFHIIKVAFSTPLGALSDRIGRKIVINIGWTIYAAVYLCFAFIDELPGAWQIGATLLLFAIYALYYAFTEGVEKAFVADLVDPSVRGSAFGMYNFAIGLGALPASVLFGIVYGTFGAGAAFGGGAAIAALAMILLATIVKEPSRS
jgi:MFS family permease